MGRLHTSTTELSQKLGKGNAAVPNNRTPFPKKVTLLWQNQKLSSIRAAGGCVISHYFFRTPHRPKGGRSKKGEKEIEKAATSLSGPS